MKSYDEQVTKPLSIAGKERPGKTSDNPRGGAVHLTRNLATELAKSNINVNAIAPGYFQTKMTAGMAQNESVHNAAVAQIPRGRPGSPEDMAGTAIYLVSRASAWLDGHTIVLDGGNIA